MVKAIGCLFLLSACSLGGIHLSSRIREQERLVETLLKFFRGIEGELTYGGAPVGELLQKAAQDPRFAGLDFLPLCCRGMETGAFSASFCSAVEGCRCLQKSPPSLRQLMLDFGREFGTRPSPVELSRLALLVQKLEEQLEETREAYRKNGKMYNTLGVLAGLGLSIILW